MGRLYYLLYVTFGEKPESYRLESIFKFASPVGTTLFVRALDERLEVKYHDHERCGSERGTEGQLENFYMVLGMHNDEDIHIEESERIKFEEQLEKDGWRIL